MLGSPYKIFDWLGAVDLLIENLALKAEAGLREDWDHTSDIIWDNYGPIIFDDSKLYLSSNWATPALKIENRMYNCWVYEVDFPSWQPDEFWPPEALDLLNSYTEGSVDINYVSVTNRCWD
jgi:hypothetical protein